MLAPAHLVALTLAVFADRDRSAELPELLRRIETLPERQSGEVRTVQPGDTPDGQPTEHLYQYTLDGGHFLYRTVDLSRAETEPDQMMVWAENERCRFELGRRDGRWVLNWASMIRGRGPPITRLHERDGRLYLVYSVFYPSYYLLEANQPLSELMTAADSAFALTTTRVDRQGYRVTGRRRESTETGVEEFEATVRVAANGRYAYIAAGRTVWLSRTTDRNVTEWTHTAREGDFRPELTRREWVGRHPGLGGDRVIRGHSTYTTRPVTDDDRRQMYLSYYGLTEPDADSWPEPLDFQAGVPRPHRGWWALLAVPAVYVFILGRILWRAFRRPLNG